jgi:hypothetical protein
MMTCGVAVIFLRFAEVRFAAQGAKLEKATASSRRGSRRDEPAAYLNKLPLHFDLMPLCVLAKPKHGLGVLRGAEAAVGAELVRCCPKAFFQSIGCEVLFAWCYPLHEGALYLKVVWISKGT